MFLEEMTKLQKPSVISKGKKGAIFLANNRQVFMRTKHIDVRHHFLRDRVEDKDVDFQYIHSEDNPGYIMTKNTLAADFMKHVNSSTEGKL